MSLSAVVIGLGATLLMDVWNLLLKGLLGVPSLNFCFVGRWLLHIPDGKFAHLSIGEAPAKRFECAIGYAAHYSIGVILAIGFVAVSGSWLRAPTLLPALLYGIVTVVFPFFILQPAMGLGVASAKAKNPLQARVKSLATHSVFGAGLYVCALVLGRIVSH
jgi:hypothetical protein